MRLWIRHYLPAVTFSGAGLNFTASTPSIFFADQGLTWDDIHSQNERVTVSKWGRIVLTAMNEIDDRCAGLPGSTVRRVSGFFVDGELKTLHYNSDDCCDAMGFFTRNALKTSAYSLAIVDTPVMGHSAQFGSDGVECV